MTQQPELEPDTPQEEERWRVLSQLEEWIETPMVVLSFIWLSLVIVELIWTTSGVFELLGTIIWIVFIAAFVGFSPTADLVWGQEAEVVAAGEVGRPAPIVLLSLPLAACSGTLARRSSDADRWSSYPHTMGCTVENSGADGGHPPPSVQVEQVTVTHLGDQRIRLSLQFVNSIKTFSKRVFNR